MAIVRLDKVQAIYGGNLESVTFTADTKNGVVFALGALETGETDLHKAVAFTDVTTEEVILHASPEVNYDPRKQGLKDFVLEKGQAGRGYHLTAGDVVTITEDGFDGTPVVGEYVAPENANDLLKAIGAVAGTTRFLATVIEKTTLGADVTVAYAIKVLKA